MDENQTESIGAKVSFSEFYRIQLECKKRNISVSDFVRESVFKNIPHCSICMKKFTDKTIISPTGIRLAVCVDCAIYESVYHGARVVDEMS